MNNELLGDKTIADCELEVSYDAHVSDVPESVERFGKQNQVKRDETGQTQQELPHLDFDFGLLPDFPEVLPDPLHTRAHQGTSDSQMEVDTEMDVQDWLDSLVAP